MTTTWRSLKTSKQDKMAALPSIKLDRRCGKLAVLIRHIHVT